MPTRCSTCSPRLPPARATLVIATHDETAARLADRVIVIADGRLCEERRRDDAVPSAVVDERGWLRLPPGFREGAGIGDRAIVTPADGSLVIVARPDDAGQSRTARSDAAGSIAAPSADATSDDALPVGRVVRSLRDVARSFGETEVLQPLSMTVQRGRLHAVVGRSGSG